MECESFLGFVTISGLRRVTKLKTAVFTVCSKLCRFNSQPYRFTVRAFTKFTMPDHADVRKLVDEKINEYKVMVFSKSYCPFCTKAKQTLSKYIGEFLNPSDYEVLEIDNLPNCSEIQDYLGQKTGARSVPRVFINQKFVGGGDDVVALDKSGKLKALLS